MQRSSIVVVQLGSKCASSIYTRISQLNWKYIVYSVRHMNVIWTYEKPTSCKGFTLYFVYNLYSIKLTNDSKDFTTGNMSYRLHLIYLMLEADRINLTTFTLILVMNIF